ncbi:alpha/beta hydrolase [Aestuariivirga sp.]|uniref:alpha/beta hydrolase n=1 Tax=Aestuariivirga sp. TaxID=2650926 RepID=UPI00391E0014
MDIAAEYNNRELVPDHPRIIAEWHEAARAFRDGAPGEFDLSYGARTRNRLDYFTATEGGTGPIVIFIHGGYWRSFDKSVFSHMARGAHAHGLDVAIPGYTLCPEVTIPDIIDELRQCCLFLANRFGRRLLVVGHSAGGHLAACMAATDWQLYGARPDLVQACLSVSGLFDLRPLMATPMNEDLRLTPADAMAASPLFWPVPNRLPLDSWAGGEESFEFLRQARSLPAAWAGLGLPCRYEVSPGENHFSVVNGLSKPDHPLSRRLAELAFG